MKAHGSEVFPGSGHQAIQEEELRQLKREEAYYFASDESRRLRTIDRVFLHCGIFTETGHH